MHPEMTRQLAAQHIAELQQQAATRRLARELRGRPKRDDEGRRTVWDRLRLRHPRPAATT